MSQKLVAIVVIVGAVGWVAAQVGPGTQKGQPTTTVKQSGLDRLLARAKKSNSDAVVILRDGKLVGEWYFGKPEGQIESMSATKSIVALAFGRLLLDGRLKSLDTPVHAYFPEWNQGRKAKITIRHLLTNRSGLQSNPTTEEIYRSPDFVQLALAAELTEDPGTQFHYNNKAINLLPAIVRKITGQRLDILIGEEIFKPLGITDWAWALDSAGNPHGMSGLQIRPRDLAKLGQLMLDGGVWQGQRILPEDFVIGAVHDLNPRPVSADPDMPGMFSRQYGLLWWVVDSPEIRITDRLIRSWRKTGAPDDFIKKMETLKDMREPPLVRKAVELAGGSDKWNELTWQANRADFDIPRYERHGFSAEGWLGQYLIVLPESRIVAVRMMRTPEGEFDDRKLDTFRDFAQYVVKLAADFRAR